MNAKILVRSIVYIFSVQEENQTILHDTKNSKLYTYNTIK